MKRSHDWDSGTESILVPKVTKTSFCEPQLKSRISERDYSHHGSSSHAREIKKEIQQKTINKLFDAQKRAGKYKVIRLNYI